MILGIDASNISNGGGVTHLVELLRAVDCNDHDFSQVIVWSGEATLRRIEERPWLRKRIQPILEKSLPYRVIWQLFHLPRLARENDCDVLFVPGGSYAANFYPMVTLSQNMLPFEWREMLRYGWTAMTLKMLLLRWTQSRTFRRATGLVFLTRYARHEVMRCIGGTAGATTIIPHGIDGRFSCPPRPQRLLKQYSVARPFRILYVSKIDVYKHQWHVVEAMALLRKDNLPVVMELVGPAYAPALKRLQRTLAAVDPSGDFICYSGPALHDELHAKYARADLALFASSCENMPNILVEAMSSGLPIACSDRGPMPEILGEQGVYFDPEDPCSMAEALKKMIRDPSLRQRCAADAFSRASQYSWTRCAKETFSFLAETARPYSRSMQPHS